MRKIAVSISKGGTGKTTTSVSLAAGLATAGRRVLLIDLDTQGQAGKALGLSPAAGIAELVSGDIPPADALLEARERLWLLAGGRSLAGLKRQIARRDYAPERVLAEALEPYAGQFDYVILDTAPSWDVLNINALFYANEVLSPIVAEPLAIQGLTEFIQALQDIQRYQDGLSLRYILPTFVDRRRRQTEEILALLALHFREKLLEPIRINVRLSEAPGHGQTIFEYDPSSSGAEDYQILVERILRDA
jgi:chromosome partitioning protein